MLVTMPEEVADNRSEDTLLLPRTATIVVDQSTWQGQATFNATVVNLMKTCMGTGTLALPFAAQQGGLLLNTFGLLAIAGWNLYSVDRLCRSIVYWDTYARIRGAPPTGISTFGKVAWLAFGRIGVHGLDVMLLILFFGIIVAYEDAALGFLRDTRFNSGSDLLDALGIAVIVGTLSLVPDLGYLAKVSASGLIVLIFVFVIIAGYAAAVTVSNHPLDLWPEGGLSGISHWFGCIVFGFGVVPLTYNYYESMEQPQLLSQATGVALLGVAILYIVIGSGLLRLYYPVDGDIMEKLPIDGILPLVVRISMLTVVVFTAPLIVLPCSQILEGTLLFPTTKTKEAIVRYSVCTSCALISVGVPSFVYVLSFVGCFSVALVGFVIPPMLHLSLTLNHNVNPPKTMLLVDSVMMLWGMTATAISSVYTFKKLLIQN